MMYSGKISETANIMLPFLVTITDENGRLCLTCPASNRPEAEVRLMELLAKLQEGNKKTL